eukprot:4033522-Pyramimonas_sp.AAC.1
MSRPPCPGGGGGGGPPGGKDPFKDTLRDGRPAAGEEEGEEGEDDCMIVYEGEPGEELQWLLAEMGKRVARVWLKSRGGNGACTACR